jgi:hypothetical protein
MQGIAGMEGMDLSAGTLVAAMLVSTIGFGVFLYGKKASRVPHLATGITMMLFPMFVPGAFLNYAIGTVLLAGLWFGVRMGL